MNCKQGDLAIVVDNSPYQGMLLHCVKWAGRVEYVRDAITGRKTVQSDAWEVEWLDVSNLCPIPTHVSDCVLRPIRGTPESEPIDEQEPVEA